MPPYDQNQPPKNKPLGPVPKTGFGLNAAQAQPVPTPGSGGFQGTYPPELDEVNPEAEPSPAPAPTPAPRGATSQDDVNALLGQQPETGFLQAGPVPSPTPTPVPGSPAGPPPANFRISDLVGTRPLLNPPPREPGSYGRY